MILYIGNPKDSIKKLKMKNKISTVTRYKINIQKSAAFIYSNNELLEREINTILFTIVSKNKK